ncbi:MAG: endonuclease/exonuclease/phosphatase family protein [Albidovulum sp.]|nr:endonuclease/exonuclease/phosphatase family protein [Albidovulum sp.]
MRIFLYAALALSFAASTGYTAEIKIGAWNLEHLNDSDMEGCKPRKQNDYALIRAHIEASGVDVVAIQEVENRAAARRVFPEDEWHLEISSRPDIGDIRECWGRPGQYLKHLATGFAIRRGLDYSRNRDLDGLALGNGFARWGTDITLGAGANIRMLSVHLRSGCWGAKEDAEERREEACREIRGQIDVLASWIEDLARRGQPFVILGDFNRRFTIPGDWAWMQLSSTTAGELQLATQGLNARCDPRFRHFIDHLVADSRAWKQIVPGSFEEVPNEYDHSDHCLIALKMTIPD